MVHPIDSGFIRGAAQPGIQPMSSGFHRGGSSGSTLLLDLYPSATVAYSFRKLRTAYAGSAVRIRRSSDDAEADIGFSGNDFDSAAAAAHIGGGSGFIAKWYDQSGNGWDLVQSTGSTQPTYLASGINSGPTVHCDSDGDVMLTAAAVDMVATTCTMVMVLDPTSLPEGIGGYTQNSPIGFWYIEGFGGEPPTSIHFHLGGSRAIVDQAAATWFSGEKLFVGYRDSSDNQVIRVNGSDLDTETHTADANSSDVIFTLNGFHDAPGFANAICLYAEFVVWPADLAGGRAGMETNVNNYYTVF